MARSEIPISVLLQYFRVPTGDLLVDYPGREVLLGSCVTNMSTTGAFIRTNTPLAVGTELEIIFTLPTPKTKIKAKTRVRWRSTADSEDPSAPVGMGVEFLRMAPGQRRAIARFVEEFLQRMRESR